MWGGRAGGRAWGSHHEGHYPPTITRLPRPGSTAYITQIYSLLATLLAFLTYVLLCIFQHSLQSAISFLLILCITRSRLHPLSSSSLFTLCTLFSLTFHFVLHLLSSPSTLLCSSPHTHTVLFSLIPFTFSHKPELFYLFQTYYGNLFTLILGIFFFLQFFILP